MIHLLVYISTAAAAVLSIIQAGKQILPWIAGIVVYVLAAVLLTLSCVFFLSRSEGECYKENP